jgi:hypothetical protein
MDLSLEDAFASTGPTLGRGEGSRPGLMNLDAIRSGMHFHEFRWDVWLSLEQGDSEGKEEEISQVVPTTNATHLSNIFNV